jgi:anhydro-N-acetylmuramic acid kinase
MPSNSARLAVGTMTGTSIDAIDVALVRIGGRGLNMQAELVRYSSHQLGDLRGILRAAANQAPMSARRWAKTAAKFAMLHADVIESLLYEADEGTPDLVCVHGQTVYHKPPYSFQIVNPTLIATRLRCPVVTDLRQADLAAGGEGAPITPLADWILFRSPQKPRAIINLGGFCNITLLPSGDGAENIEAIRGFDVCSCNQLLDAISRATTGKQFDDGGQVATSGFADEPLRASLEQLLRWQRDRRKSLGTSDDVRPWVSQHVDLYDGPTLAATAVRGLANVIAESIEMCDIQEIYLAGGGTHNLALVGEIMSVLDGVTVAPLDKLGIEVSAREAVCMAVLGALCADGVPITLPQVTHARETPGVAGTWTGTVNAMR